MHRYNSTQLSWGTALDQASKARLLRIALLVFKTVSYYLYSTFIKSPQNDNNFIPGILFKPHPAWLYNRLSIHFGNKIKLTHYYTFTISITTRTHSNESATELLCQ